MMSDAWVRMPYGLGDLQTINLGWPPAAAGGITKFNNINTLTQKSRPPPRMGLRSPILVPVIARSPPRRTTKQSIAGSSNQSIDRHVGLPLTAFKGPYGRLAMTVPSCLRGQQRFPGSQGSRATRQKRWGTRQPRGHSPTANPNGKDHAEH